LKLKWFRLSSRWQTRLRIAVALVVLAYLAITDGERVHDAYRRHGHAMTGPLVIALLLALGTLLMFYIIFRYWERASIPVAWVMVISAILWGLALGITFIATHKMRGFRLFVKAVGQLDSGWSVAVVAYQAFVWVALAIAVIVARRVWLRAEAA
jgi:hypothetical protein